jgi:3-oxoadipate enol-lactonase
MQVQTPSFVAVKGRRLAYDEVAPEHPVGTIVLLTGLASKRFGWADQLAVFGETYRTLALDYRDTGDSDEASAGYTVADLADDVAGLLGALGIGRANIVGISLGGFVAIEVALRHPERIEKLVLTSTSAGGVTHVSAKPEILAILAPQAEVEIGERAIANYSKIMSPAYVQAHPEALEQVAGTARYHPMSAAAYGRQLQAVLGHDASTRVASITAPTLIIHGDFDPLVPVENGRYLARTIPVARYIEYPGIGHIPIKECADTYNHDVLSFLADPASGDEQGH